MIEPIVAPDGRLRVLLELDLRAFTPRRIVQRIRFLREHKNEFGRIAITANRVVGPIARARLSRREGDVRVFRRNRRDEARAWIEEGIVPATGSVTDESRFDAVDEASDESFPASDPPGYTHYRI